MKLTRPISLVLLCIAFVPSLALGQTAKIDALKEKAEKGTWIAGGSGLEGSGLTGGSGEAAARPLSSHSRLYVLRWAVMEII